MTFDWIGWIATAVFASSYLCHDQAQLRRVQALAACLWLAYGAIIGAAPVMVANLIVAGVAGWSSLRPPIPGKIPPASGA
jgi:hypothetical protein